MGRAGLRAAVPVLRALLAVPVLPAVPVRPAVPALLPVPALLAVLALLAALSACNPYWGAEQLPPARCRADLDCQRGESCQEGYCALVGWVAGRLRYADPGRSEPSALRLVVVRADSQGSSLLLPQAPGEDDILVQVDGVDTYRIDGLPRGRLQLYAICRTTGRVVGTVPFTIDDRQGFRAGVGLTRDINVDLAVDLAYCEG